MTGRPHVHTHPRDVRELSLTAHVHKVMPASSRPASITLLALLLVACASPGAPTPSVPHAPGSGESPSVAAPRAAAGDAQFQLSIRAGRDRYRAGEPIEVSAALRYLGPDERLVLSGSGSGLVLFSLEQVDGPLDTAAVATSDCARHGIGQGERAFRFAKSGGYSADDPDAAFWNSFFRDPELRLPAGTWRVTARASFFVGDDCSGRPRDLAATITLEVR